MIPWKSLVAGIALVLIVACGGEDGPAASELGDASGAAKVLVHLVNPLDDPGYYCIDVVGFGSGAQFRSALQAHTCKPDDNNDQQFTRRPASGQLYMAEYALCLQPENLVAGAELYLRDCSDTPLQAFEITNDGLIRLDDDGPGELCVAVALGEGERINSIHLRRDLSVVACDATASDLISRDFSENAPGTISGG